MAQKDVGNKVPIYKLKETKEVMDFYDEWGLDNKYDKDMVEWNYTGPKETVEVFNKHQKEKLIPDINMFAENSKFSKWPKKICISENPNFLFFKFIQFSIRKCRKLPYW